MDVVFNELSMRYHAKSRAQAHKWMVKFFNTIIELEKRIHKKIHIRSATKFSEILLTPTYSFIEWLGTIPEGDFKRRVIGFLSQSPIVINYPYFTFEGIDCKALGICMLERRFSISYPSKHWSTHIQIQKHFFDEQSEDIIIETAIIHNMSLPTDVYKFFPARTFEHHTKHDNRRRNLLDGESTLEYFIPEQIAEVQKLLDCSVSTSTTSTRIYNFDTNRRKYMEFNAHRKAKFHGYHITDDNRVDPPDKKLIEEFKKM